MPTFRFRMKARYISALLLICSCLITSCKKDKKKDPEGLFKGTYTLTIDPGTPGQSIKSGPTELFFGENRYSLTEISKDAPPAGSGNYQIDENIIYFFDDRPRESNFDRSLIVQDDYIMVYDGQDLYLIQQTKRWGNDRKYELRLVKQ